MRVTNTFSTAAIDIPTWCLCCLLQAPAGAPPDVWRQLPSFVLQQLLPRFDSFAHNTAGMREVLCVALSVTSQCSAAVGAASGKAAGQHGSSAGTLGVDRAMRWPGYHCACGVLSRVECGIRVTLLARLAGQPRL